MSGIVDAHVHIWDPARVHYPWMADTPSLHRAIGLPHMLADHLAAGVEQVVLVQAADDPTDTELMLEAAHRDPRVLGVVAWAPLDDVVATSALVDGWSDEPVVGVRHLAHRDPDPDFLVRPNVIESLRLLGTRGLTFDVCAETLHLLELVPVIADAAPATTFVVNHLAKPPISTRGWEPWASLFTAAAERGNVVAKLSGLNTAAADGWSGDDFAPYVAHALDTFGADRLLFGGDWPFAALAADSYAHVVDALMHTIAALTDAERTSILSGNARRVYGRPFDRRESSPSGRTLA